MSNDTIISLFKEVINSKYPGTIFAEEKIKNWAKNRKIAIKPKDGTEKTLVVNLTHAIVSRIPRNRFEPVLVFGNKGKVVLLGARLTAHGGHLAVEVSRKLASENKLKLVILERMVICFLILKAMEIKPDINADMGSMEKVETEITAKITLLAGIHDKFVETFKKAIQ
ncbi:MAG: hypothetical protein ACFFCS_05120 [Candidatus Hodarchaeota archaeon]